MEEIEQNIFDTPVPGQSLTDEPGNYPWEHTSICNCRRCFSFNMEWYAQRKNNAKNVGATRIRTNSRRIS